MTGFAGIIAIGIVGLGVVGGGELTQRVFPIHELTKTEFRTALYAYPLRFASPTTYGFVLGKATNRQVLGTPIVWEKVSTRANFIWPFSLIPALAVGWAIASGTSVRVSRNGRYLRGRKLHVGKQADVELKRYLQKEIKKDGEGLRVLDVAAYSAELECRHGFVIGGVGSGKTVYIRRLINAARERDDKLLVHDVKGDFTSQLDGSFLLLAPHDKRSAIWDIAADVRTESDAHELAARLIVEGKDPFWSQAAQSLLIGWLLYLMRMRGEKWGWSDISDLAECSRDRLVEVMSEHYPAAMTFIESDNAMTNSVIASLKAPLLSIRMLAQAWPSDDTRPRFSFSKWFVEDNANQRTVVFQSAPNLPKLSTAWINAAFQLSARFALSSALPDNPRSASIQDQRRVWYLLDELPSLGKLPAIESLIALGRSKGLRVFAGCQSWEQLVELYGSNVADSWLGMSATLVALYSKGRSADRLSDVFGDAEYEVIRRAESIDISSKRRTQNYTPQLEKKKVLLPADFERLGKRKLRNGKYGIGGYLLLGGDAYEIEYSFVKEEFHRPPTLPADWVTKLSKTEKTDV